jgi:hypothetical protein
VQRASHSEQLPTRKKIHNNKQKQSKARMMLLHATPRRKDKEKQK